MHTSESIENLSKALAEFRKEAKQPTRSKTVKVKTRTGGNYEYAYAPLEKVVEVIDSIACKHGLSYVQEAYTADNGSPAIVTRLIHASGEWIEARPMILASNNSDAQSQGSAITYARRYQLSALFGIAADDDDDGDKAIKHKADTAPIEMTLKEALQVTMPFGKNRGKTLQEIGTENSDYIKWLAGQEISDRELEKAVELIIEAGKKQSAPVADEYALPDVLPSEAPKQAEQVSLDWMNA